MRKLLAIAAFVLASSAAQAQYTFEYGGRTIRVDPDRGTVSIPGVYDNTGRKSKRSQDSDHSHKQAPQQAKGDPQTPDATAPAPAAPEPAPAPATTAVPQPPAPATAAVEPSDTITSTQPPAASPSLQDQQDIAPARPAAPPAPPIVATAPTPTGSLPVPPPNSPLGLWLTEEKEGKVRIEQCGANLCGYSVDTKTDKNGEQVLLNMKPGKDKWTGRIYDPKSGSTYDSTIAMKTQDSLRVQGCALGGMFCGGQTWSRIN